MRVLLVTDTLGMGGLERQMTLLAASLPPSHPVTVFCLGGGDFVDVLRNRDIPVEILPRRFRFDVSPAVKMWGMAASIRPDLVHSWSWMTTLAMAPFCRLMRIPLVDGTIRVGRRPDRWHPLARLSMGLADRVVANSHAGLDAFGVSEARGRVVYNGFDASRVALIPPWTEPSRFPALTTVVMAARMYPEKDWSMLFRAAKRLSATDPGRWRFFAIGEGPNRDSLMQEAADLVSLGVLAFPRAGIEVLPIVASSDIGVLLTNSRIWAEGCSNSIMEYMACGLPVVCTQGGGNPELVEDGNTGYLVPSFDDELLAARLLELRDNPRRARAMGDAGARRLQEAFTVQSMVEGYLSVYDWAHDAMAAEGAESRVSHPV